MLSYVTTVAAVNAARLADAAPSNPQTIHLFDTTWSGAADFAPLRDRLMEYLRFGQPHYAELALKAWAGTRYLTDETSTVGLIARETGRHALDVSLNMEASDYCGRARAVAYRAALPLKCIRDRTRRVVADLIGHALPDVIRLISQHPGATRMMAEDIDRILCRAIDIAPQTCADSLAWHAQESTFHCAQIAGAVAWDAYNTFLQPSAPRPAPGNIRNFIDHCVHHSDDASHCHSAASPATSAENLALRMYIDTRFVLDPLQTITSIASILNVPDQRVSRFLSTGPNYEKLFACARGSPIKVALLRRTARHEAMQCLMENGSRDTTRTVATRIMTSLDRLYQSREDHILDRTFAALSTAGQ